MRQIVIGINIVYRFNDVSSGKRKTIYKNNYVRSDYIILNLL